MSNKTIFVANWKMNKTNNEAVEFVNKLLPHLENITSKIVIIPPTIALSDIYKLTQYTNLKLAVQNIFYEPRGAFTGETSAEMANQFCDYVLIGHSERRHLFGETNDEVNKKIHSALTHQLIPLLCVGETRAHKDAGETEKILNLQLVSALKDVISEQIKKIVFAYEPVWAISQGTQDTNTKPATPEDAQKAHEFIRKWLAKTYTSEIAQSVKIVYGGSAKPENASDLMKQIDIDGLLVGAASLDVEKFIKIIRS